MTARQALVIACFVVSPGVVLRVVPHLDRLVAIRAEVRGAATGAPSVPASIADKPLPSQLSQRPTAALAFGFAIELALQIALLVSVLRSGLFAWHWQALPPSFRAAAALLFTLLMSGFLGGTSSTFPFVAWRMYSGEHDDVPAVYGIAGTTRSGVAREVDIERLIPVLGAHRLHHILDAQTRWVDEPTDDVERGARQDLQRKTLAALGHVYNLRNRNEPLRQLSLHVARVPLDAGRPPWLRDRRLICTADVEQ